MRHAHTYGEIARATLPVSQRVQRHRTAMREAGYRLVQVWVPDTRQPDFAAECRRQCRLASQADANDQGLQDFLDEALTDIADMEEGWVG